MKFMPFRKHFFARISLRKFGLFYFRIYERSLKNFSFHDLGPKMAGDRAFTDEILRVLFDYQIFNQIDFRRKIFFNFQGQEFSRPIYVKRLKTYFSAENEVFHLKHFFI